MLVEPWLITHRSIGRGQKEIDQPPNVVQLLHETDTGPGAFCMTHCCSLFGFNFWTFNVRNFSQIERVQNVS